MLKIEPGNETLMDGQTHEPTIRYIRGYALCGKNHYVATNLKWQNSIQVSSGNSSTNIKGQNSVQYSSGNSFKWQMSKFLCGKSYN